MKINTLIIIVMGMLFFSSTPAKAELLIDDFSPDNQYNVNQRNDLDGFTTGAGTMVYDAVADGILKLSWICPTSTYWLSFTMPYSGTPQYTDMSAYEGIDFYMRGKAGGEQFTLNMSDNTGSHWKNITLSSSWSHIFVPFSELSNSASFDASKVACVVFNSFQPNSGTMYVDNISAIPEPSSVVLLGIGLIGIADIVGRKTKKK